MSRRRSDEGFTLLELIIAMACMVIVLGVLASAVFVTVSTSSDSNQQLLESQATGLASAHVTRDVASATTLVVNSATCSGAGTPLLQLAWTDVSTSVVVDYRFEASSGTLTRYEWRGLGCGSTPTSTSAFGNSLTSATISSTSSGAGRAGVKLVLAGRLGTQQEVVAYRRLS